VANCDRPWIANTGSATRNWPRSPGPPPQLGSSPIPQSLVFLRLLSTKAPSLPRRYPASSVLRASPPPQTARPDSHELPVDRIPITAGASRVTSGPLCLHAVATTPAGPMDLSARLFPSTSAFPRFRAGRLLHCLFRGLHSVYIITAYKLAKSPARPSTSEASAASLPPLLLRLLPGGANQFPGGTFPAVDQRLFTAYRKFRLA
jgi:hypothetical protein